ncbi:MAG: formate dehydrogenase [Burkholderiaceae bacterium]|nr:formate dehydrogenase [Burkholderiaceae bacterium]
MNESKPAALSRRRLFAGGGTAGALAAVAVALPLARPAEPVVAAAKPAPDKGGGYQLTQHVLDYYQTTRV